MKFIFILIMFILYIFFIKTKIEEHFEQKIIISIFSEKYGLGIGDYMRGLIFINKNCDGNCKVYADYQDHKISNFLINTEIKPDYSKSNINRIWDKDTIDNMSNEVNFVYCNVESEGKITPKIQKYLLNSFKMKPDFETYFETTFKELNLDPTFAVIHIRLKDIYFKDIELPNLSIIYNYIESNIIPKYKSNVIVMSNSLTAKNIIIEKYNFRQYKIIPVHTNYGDVSNDDIRDTLIEFFLISKSSEIYQFNQYLHSSGFSKRISEIYDIPLNRIFVPE